MQKKLWVRPYMYIMNHFQETLQSREGGYRKSKPW